MWLVLILYTEPQAIQSLLRTDALSSQHRASRELMRLARMLRKPEYYQELLGAGRNEVALANYHWALYILLGKLSPTLYVLRKNASS